jgi:hypothetical protein
MLARPRICGICIRTTSSTNQQFPVGNRKSLAAHQLIYQHTQRACMPASVPSACIRTLQSHFDLRHIINSSPFLDARQNTKHYTFKDADHAFGLLKSVWDIPWDNHLVLCPPEKDLTYKYLRWTICSVRHGTQPSISVVITAQGGAETHCKGLLQHPSIFKIGSLNPLNNGGPTSATQPRKCTVWAVVSGTARNALPDQMARLHHDTARRNSCGCAGPRDTLQD